MIFLKVTAPCQDFMVGSFPFGDDQASNAEVISGGPRDPSSIVGMVPTSTSIFTQL